MKDIVLQYYDAVDSGELDTLYALFSDDIEYQRCEENILGIEALKEFYSVNRTIHGKHTVYSILFEKDTVATRGVFKGKNGRDEDIILNFADFFVFNQGGQIAKRFTYLAEGFDKTQ
jgi:ketosteroid isomerase-like protein